MNYYSLIATVEASDSEEWIKVEDGPDAGLTTVIYALTEAAAAEVG